MAEITERIEVLIVASTKLEIGLGLELNRTDSLNYENAINLGESLPY